MAGQELALPFALRFPGKRAIGDDFGHLRSETAKRVGKLGTGQIAARKKDALASQLRGKFLSQSHALMLRGDVTYGQTRSASCFGGDRTYRRDAKCGKRTQHVAPKGFRAF